MQFVEAPMNLRDDKAYVAMFVFLEGIYQRGQSADIGALLGSMSLLPDGLPADPALVEDWVVAKRSAESGTSEIALRLEPRPKND